MSTNFDVLKTLAKYLFLDQYYDSPLVDNKLLFSQKVRANEDKAPGYSLVALWGRTC